MSYPVIIIPRQVKVVADPVKKRHLCIRVMPTHKQNTGMQRDERINERGELEFTIGDGQRRQGKNCRKYFQRPGEVIVRMDRRPRQHSSKSAEQKYEGRFLFSKHSFHRHFLSRVFSDSKFSGRCWSQKRKPHQAARASSKTI